MKHEILFCKILSELHAEWMDEEDKRFFNSEMITQFGDKVDADVDIGIANGFSEDEQEKIVRLFVRGE